MEENTYIKELIAQQQLEIREIKEELKKQVEFNTQLVLLNKTVNDLNETVKSLKANMEAINNKPNEMVDKLKIAAITAIITTIIGFIFGNILR